MLSMNATKLLCLVGAATLGALAPVALAQAPKSIDVDEAVRIALDQNYTYRQAKADVSAAAGSRLEAIAGLLPSATGSVSYTESDRTSTLIVIEQDGVPIPSLPIPTGSRTKTTASGISLRQDFSLPLWYLYRSANANARAAQHGHVAAGQDLAFQVRQQFFLVLRAQDLRQVQEEDLRLARDEERRINSMFELGSVARVDVLKARVRVADAEVALIRQQNQVAIERTRLTTLLGFSPNTPLQLTGDLSAEVVAVDSTGAVDEATRRPDLLQVQGQYGSASNLYKAAVTSRLPNLFATVSWNTSSGDGDSDNLDFSTGVPRNVNTLFDTDSDSWTLRVGASVNLDAFLNMGQHKRTRAAKQWAAYQLENKKLAVQQELEEAILNSRASISSIDASERGVESAEEDLRLSQERYRQGLGTVLELLEAQVNLTRARNSLVNSLTGLKISEAALDRARGAPLPY